MCHDFGWEGDVCVARFFCEVGSGLAGCFVECLVGGFAGGECVWVHSDAYPANKNTSW